MYAISGAYPRLWHLKGVSLGKAHALPTKLGAYPRVEHLKVYNKLECLLLASLSSLVVCLCVIPGAYPIVVHLKGLSLG